MFQLQFPGYKLYQIYDESDPDAHYRWKSVDVPPGYRGIYSFTAQFVCDSLYKIVSNAFIFCIFSQLRWFTRKDN